MRTGEALLRRPFSPDGRFLASASHHRGAIPNSTVRILDLATGREVRRFEGHRGSVNAVAFTPDCRSIVSGSEDATALVWDISDLHDGRESGMRLSPEVLKSRWAEFARNDARRYRAGWALSVPSAVGSSENACNPPRPLTPRVNPRRSGRSRHSRSCGPSAIAALERVGTPEARAILERMAGELRRYRDPGREVGSRPTESPTGGSSGFRDQINSSSRGGRARLRSSQRTGRNDGFPSGEST